jgi:glycosyltransferase involved in cell wall biosynthesis
MVDIRWFAETAHGALVVPRLQALGLSIVQTGDEPAKIVVAVGNNVATQAWRFAVRHRSEIVQLIWDLPPWRLGQGRYDHIWSVNGTLIALPRLGRRYAQRAGMYSRLRYVASRARVVWLPSEATADDVRTKFGLHGELMHYCYNSDHFTPGEGDRSPTETPTLLSVSRLMPMKNHEAVIRAGQRLGMAVRIIGPGPLRDELQRQADDLGGRCSIESGWLTDDEVLAAYRQAAVVVCPSRFEGMGVSGLEAVGCGTPVVASNISPHREFLGSVAHFFDLDDDASMDRAIHSALLAPRPTANDVVAYSIGAAADRLYKRLAELLR